MSFEKNEVSSESIINRRNFMGLALASGAAFTLAACSGESTSSSTSGGSGETRKIEDIDEEEVNVPVKPQRVVTLSEPTLDAALALGINPVGTVSGRGQSTVPNYLKEKAKDVPLIGTVAQVNYEKIDALEPDLILVDSTGVDKRSDAYSTLTKIAPVVYCGYAGGDWRFRPKSSRTCPAGSSLRIRAGPLPAQRTMEKVLSPYLGASSSLVFAAKAS